MLVSASGGNAILVPQTATAPGISSRTVHTALVALPATLVTTTQYCPACAGVNRPNSSVAFGRTSVMGCPS